MAWRHLHVIIAVALAALLIEPGDPVFAEQLNESAFHQCRTIADDAARLRCFENIDSNSKSKRPFSETAPDAASGSPSMDKWRLVRIPNPQGEKDAISVTHASEPSSSDTDFAGLMLRCGDLEIEVLIAVIGPFPLHDRPQVTLVSGGLSYRFGATVVPPGALVLLPPEAINIARSTWPSIGEISVSIESPPRALVKGVVRLDGFRNALRTLMANCSVKGS